MANLLLRLENHLGRNTISNWQHIFSSMQEVDMGSLQENMSLLRRMETVRLLDRRMDSRT